MFTFFFGLVRFRLGLCGCADKVGKSVLSLVLLVTG